MDGAYKLSMHNCILTLNEMSCALHEVYVKHYVKIPSEINVKGCAQFASKITNFFKIPLLILQVKKGCSQGKDELFSYETMRLQEYVCACY